MAQAIIEDRDSCLSNAPSDDDYAQDALIVTTMVALLAYYSFQAGPRWLPAHMKEKADVFET